MVRKIVKIDNEKCNGCGLCAEACHEGAIAIRGGKAVLIRDDYCDGLGNCLPACPTDAIQIEEREAAPFDLAAAEKNKGAPPARRPSWPIQIKLTSTQADRFAGADLLVSADCCAFAAQAVYTKEAAGRQLVIGCPKLDDVDYSEKLAEIFRLNDVKSITVLRMEVPCCGGMVWFVKKALQMSQKSIPCRALIITLHGEFLSEEVVSAA
jgi:NAD-dependent dihydropyrimidine dehydrogenase PreA subunit